MSFRGVSKVINELRVHFSPMDAQSAGIRSFIKNRYPALKAENPNLPIHVREAFEAQPVMTARYAFGEEHSVSLGGLGETQIEEELSGLVAYGKKLNPPK